MNTKLENVSLIEDYNGWITGSDGVSRRIDGLHIVAFIRWSPTLIQTFGKTTLKIVEHCLVCLH